MDDSEKNINMRNKVIPVLIYHYKELCQNKYGDIFGIGKNIFDNIMEKNADFKPNVNNGLGELMRCYPFIFYDVTDECIKMECRITNSEKASELVLAYIKFLRYLLINIKNKPSLDEITKTYDTLFSKVNNFDTVNDVLSYI